ncbi:MAG: hypothetical protein FWF15_06030 [Oscillospiraceae bacterium]|nr:hypothetical protein [Oscillospiraceae bacterium]
MTNRELFHATMRRENGDKLLHFELAFNVPYKKWYEQGMPSHVQPGWYPILNEAENLYDHFNVTGILFTPDHPQPGEWHSYREYCIPGYEYKVLSDDGKRMVSINDLGNTMVSISPKVQVDRNDGAHIGSPPHEIDFAVKTREDYERTRRLFTGNIEQRYSKSWIERSAPVFKEQTDHISMLWTTGPYAFLRTILGTETAMTAPYEDPEWIRMMLSDHLRKSMEAAEPIIREIGYDASFVWEDCCGKSGPFIAPAMFDEEFAWWYREWKDFTKSMGIPWVMLDTDGDPTALVSRWYENGVDCMHPWEVNCVDILKIAEDFPNYILMGGIYKHMFEPAHPGQVGRFKTTDICEAIDAELERVVAPMRKRGGYFPSLDHAAHSAVRYKHYKYYSERMMDYGKANTVKRFGR